MAFLTDMGRRRRNNLTEINLTPLLDVLFSILFIVMMTGAQTRDEVQRSHAEEIARLESENERLSDELTASEEQLSAYRAHESDSVILTVRNTVRDEGHVLLVYRGTEESEIASIRMGLEQTRTTGTRLRSLIEEMAEENEGKPVYIIFYCDKTAIYTREYNTVVEVFEELQNRYKEVFFKIGEEDDL
ncbi:MAG: biopolymer transporter ExbD [Lachnospiraceae bacterium]|nr:biopolymer transporter ExbD [Lachnospiraceae bacterium]